MTNEATETRTLATYMAQPHIAERNAEFMAERGTLLHDPVRTKVGAKVHKDGNCGVWAAKRVAERDWAHIPATSLCNKCFGYYGAAK